MKTVTSTSFCTTTLVDHYRCPEGIPAFGVADGLKKSKGFFRFEDIVCYGQTTGNARSVVNGDLFDASRQIRGNTNAISLPFDTDQIINNLRYERYINTSDATRWTEKSWVQSAYYCFRPMFPGWLRSYLQRIYLRGWDAIAFPNWPVDRSVDMLFEKLLALALHSAQTKRLPFIWFWPQGHNACAVVTHDVETTAGRDFTGQLMDIDQSYGILTSFQVVPEKRYTVPPEYLDSIRQRGFELNIHGLDHEGNLFQNRETFLTSASQINQYAKLYGARGFRSPVMYRNVDWLQDLDFSYDMSVPNVARLEAQRGGCCTVMPYFLPGNITELPLTTAEDYTLFHILNDYSTKVWKEQMGIILKAHGLMSFIIHPDYIIAPRAQDVYKALLEELCRLRSDEGVWIALPGEVDEWWRQRSHMRLVRDGDTWKIEGAGSERARVAYAYMDNGKLAYEVPL